MPVNKTKICILYTFAKRFNENGDIAKSGVQQFWRKYYQESVFYVNYSNRKCFHNQTFQFLYLSFNQINTYLILLLQITTYFEDISSIE